MFHYQFVYVFGSEWLQYQVVQPTTWHLLNYQWCIGRLLGKNSVCVAPISDLEMREQAIRKDCVILGPLVGSERLNSLPNLRFVTYTACPNEIEDEIRTSHRQSFARTRCPTRISDVFRPRKRI